LSHALANLKKRENKGTDGEDIIQLIGMMKESIT
jgi:hypothetical protein